MLWLSPLVAPAQSVLSAPTSGAAQPNSWIDHDTGHRVIQLTTEPNSIGLYFNENAFTPDGKEMIYLAGRSIYVLDMTTYKTRKLIDGPVGDIVVGHKSPVVYFMKPNDVSLYAVGVNSGQILKIANLPERASIDTLNADETLAAGTYIEVPVPAHPIDPNLKPGAVRATMMDQRLAAHLPMVLFTLNLQTGEIRTILHSTDWLNHLQFSPKDPTLLMYCHEGLWIRVDRIWTIRTDGSHNELVHKRTMNEEIAGHEFWDPDGKTIWYDLQVPRARNFYLASYNTDTKERFWYSVERDAWSIHYNVASDGSMLCGDGASYARVGKSHNGQWIELFSPRKNVQPPEVDQTGLVQSGFFVTQHLVNMAKQDYRLEPNVRFSPDHKLVIFTSNMFGPSYVFAVEVRKAPATPAPAE